MQLALEQASLASGHTSPNPLVGCVIVKDGQILATGYHAKAGAAHAEINALKQAGDAASGADMYVTLEPCAHYGKTPPCVDSVIAAGLKRVIVAMTDPNPLVAGKSIAKLRAANISVKVGLFEQQAAQLNEVFIKWILTKQPFIVSKLAISLDGKIATQTGKSQWITNLAARAQGHALRALYDAIAVGVNTVIADNPQLTCRLTNAVQAVKQPSKIIFDSQGRTPLDARLWQVDSPTIIVTSSLCSPTKRQQLQDLGAQVVVCRQQSGQVDITAACSALAKLGIQSILLEGGAKLNGAFYQAKLVDKIHCFIGAKVLAGAPDLVAISGQGIHELTDALQLDFTSCQIIDNNIWLQAYNRHRIGKYPLGNN